MLNTHHVTYFVPRLASLVALLAVPVLGCSDLSGSDGTGGSGGAGAAGGVAGDGGASGAGGSPPVTMLVNTFEVLPGGGTGPLEGVRICQLDTDNCATSNEAGRAALDLPGNQEVAYTAEKEGYGSFLTPFVTDDTFPGMSGEPMHTHEQLAAIAEQVGVPYPWTSGVFGLTTRPELAGATVALVDATGQPFYLDAMRRYSFELDATSGLPWWPSPLAMGGFAGLSEGEYQVEFGGAAGNCGPQRWGWPGDAPNRVRIPVRVGYISAGGLECGGP